MKMLTENNIKINYTLIKRFENKFKKKKSTSV